VLAVDENLRYGPVKSGYHGGASPAEVVVPVTILVPGTVPVEAEPELRLAPPQEPAWWTDPILPGIPPADMITQRSGRVARSPEARTAAPPKPAPNLRKRPDEGMATLFDDTEAVVPAPAHEPETAPAPDSVAAAVLKSQAYTAHKKRIGRVSVTDDQVRALLTALLAALSRRLAPAAAASALGVPGVLLHGAVLQAQQLLNIDGYAVLRIDADGATVILDDVLLAEQYGIRL
jgi:hypothetical protein